MVMQVPDRIETIVPRCGGGEAAGQVLGGVVALGLRFWHGNWAKVAI